MQIYEQLETYYNNKTGLFLDENGPWNLINDNDIFSIIGVDAPTIEQISIITEEQVNLFKLKKQALSFAVQNSKNEYSMFISVYNNIKQELINNGIQISQNITYQELIPILTQCNDLVSIKNALTLTLLWQDVIVKTETTAAEAYKLLPATEYSRLINLN